MEPLRSSHFIHACFICCPAVASSEKSHSSRSPYHRRPFPPGLVWLQGWKSRYIAGRAKYYCQSVHCSTRPWTAGRQTSPLWRPVRSTQVETTARVVFIKLPQRTEMSQSCTACWGNSLPANLRYIVGIIHIASNYSILLFFLFSKLKAPHTHIVRNLGVIKLIATARRPGLYLTAGLNKYYRMAWTNTGTPSAWPSMQPWKLTNDDLHS